MTEQKHDDARGASRSNAVLEAELLEKRWKLIEQRAQVNREIFELDCALQRLCKHDWKWEQVAGEGKTCVKCGAHDYRDD